MKLKTLLTLVGLAAACGGGTAQAQDTITLRLADYLPAGHYITRHATEFFMDEVTSRTEGRVQFEYYPAQQLGKAKDLLALTQSGVADIGLVVPSYVGDKMPLSAVAELPAGFKTNCQGMKAYWDVGHGILAEEEFAPNGVRMIFPIVIGPYQVFSADRQIKQLDDFEGLKMYTSGGAKDLTARSLEAVSIRMTTPEIYESLSRGTLDSMMLPYATVLAYDMQGLIDYATLGESFGGASLNFMISEDRWQALPEDVRAAITEVAEETVDHSCALFDQDVAADIAKLEEAGVTIEPLDESARGAVDEILERVATDWASDLDEQGKPGSEVLAAYRAALAEAAE